MPQAKQTHANRRTALLAAAQCYPNGLHIHPRTVLEMADEFLVWLEDEDADRRMG